MSNIDAKISDLRSRIAESQRAQARAGTERDKAQGALEATRKALQDEFGVTSPEDGRALLARLEDEQAAEEQRVRVLLEQAGGGQ